MAKRSDSVSRQVTKAVRQARRDDRGRTPLNPIRQNRNNLERVRSMGYATQNDTVASIRYRGRRGVRARRRAERIQARQIAGTYRQPGSGSVSNSP